MSIVRRETRGATALLVMNRPKALNALDAATLEALGQEIAAVASDPDLRALVVTGEGRAFVAGADISEMQGLDAREAGIFSRLGHQTFEALEALSIPTIAAVNGFALGGGCELACACDWIYASEKARFGQPEVNLGILPGFGGTSRLVRRVGVGWAKELVMTGEPIDAETAARIGLANRIFPPEKLVDEAVAMGETIAAKGGLAIASAKRVMQQGQDADVRVAHALEQEAFAAAFATEDRKEGMTAFVEKRDPAFKNR
ncbi:MAG: enoyl-CoA hydratase-related protein [Myxococcota bacterium]